MSCEIGSTYFNEIDQYIDFSPHSPALDFHGAIFSQKEGSFFLKKNMILHASPTELACKVQSAFRDRNDRMAPLDTGGSVQIALEATWGSNETQVNISASAEIHDDRGNYIEAKASQDNKGEGSAGISASHKSEK